MAGNNLKTRITQLEQRQMPPITVGLIVITALGDEENRPRLVARRGRIGFFEAVPDGTTWQDLDRLYR
jgi:hypothetical protein